MKRFVLLVSMFFLLPVCARITLEAELQTKEATERKTFTFESTEFVDAFTYNDKEFRLSARTINNKKARILIEVFKKDKAGKKSFMGRPTMTAFWGKKKTFKAPKRAQENLSLTLLVHKHEDTQPAVPA